MGKSFNIFKLGALVGGALGLLFAPKSGKKIREDITEFAEEHKKDLNAVVETAKKDIKKAKNFVDKLKAKKSEE
jgi:gas vesicle protein